MDGPRFDVLTMALTTETGRRRLVLRLLAGGTLAALLARLGRGAAGAACRKVGKPCIKRGRCCPGARCKSGKCRCKSGWKDCDGDGRCEDLRADNARCGSCRNRCPETAICQGGTCHCPGGQRNCNGTCQECCDHPDCRPDQQCDFFGFCVCPSQTRECNGACAVCCEDGHCATGQYCAGGSCLDGQGTCLNGADVCNGTGGTCNGSSACWCVQSVEGATRCGANPPLLGCGVCTSSADCAAFGPGAVCVTDTGADCACPTGDRFCMVPCPS